MDRTLTLGSLFSGSGGFELGGMLAGIQPIWNAEIEPFCIRVTTKRLPDVAHMGDVCMLDGARLPPVDIITFGSPCTDLSIAGKRAGINGSQSGLFFEAIRIVKEMRCKTNGEYPRYIVWENVAGLFSSKKGDDFKAVLEEICHVKDKGVSIPKPKKWEGAGAIVGDDYSIAWRVLDSQYWGLPQRRKRIYLVADFASRSASKVLFESEGVSGYSSESFRTWQEATRSSRSGTKEASELCLNDQGGSRMDVSYGITGTLRAQSNHPPLVFENNMSDARYKGPLDVAPTVMQRYGTGGNNQPLVAHKPMCYDVRFTSRGTINARGNCYETSTSRTVDRSGNNPDSNQGGIAVIEGNGSRPSHRGDGYKMSDVMYTLNATEKHAVVTYCTSKNSTHTRANKELAGPLVATDYKDPPIIGRSGYVVRRLTPVECGRLQGFPDWWCDGLETENPTDEEIDFWMRVFETQARIQGKKPRSRAGVIKWLKSPYSDSSAYKMWGNGVALPNVYFVLAGIVYYSQVGSL